MKNSKDRTENLNFFEVRQDYFQQIKKNQILNHFKNFFLLQKTNVFLN